jgi:NAD(P)H-dependent FMN reductase
MRLLAISGSLRAGSSNTALLEAARLVAPSDVEVVLYDGLADLPAFNPDFDTVEGDRLPEPVRELRGMVGSADGILICSPEYAHGIPGSLKNLLDWLVGSVELPFKPVALLKANAHSVHAQAQLVEVLTTMNARLVEEASATVVLPSRDMSAAAIAGNEALAGALRSILGALGTASAQQEPHPREGPREDRQRDEDDRHHDDEQPEAADG